MAFSTSGSRSIALASTFAALYALLRLVPLITIIGTYGQFFTAADVLAPFYGILLGPYLGALATSAGTFIGIGLTGRTVFFGLDFLPPTASAFTLGFLMRKRWKTSASIFGGLLLLFHIHPFTLVLVPVTLPTTNFYMPFAWMHLLALLFVVSPLSGKSVENVNGASVTRLLPSVAILSFTGTLTQHVTGNILFETVYGMFGGMSPAQLSEIWLRVFWLYPIERMFIVAIATAVGVALIRTLKTIGFGMRSIQ